MLTNYERETIITFNEAEADCEVYTYNQKLIRKLTERCESHPNLYRMVAEDQFGGYTFRFPKSKLRMNFGIPLPESRQKAVAEHLAYARSKIGSKSTANCSEFAVGDVTSDG